MFSIRTIQNKSEGERKRIALGLALFFTVLLVGGSFTLSSLAENVWKTDTLEHVEDDVEMGEVLEEGKEVTSDFLFYVLLGWDDISKKVFGE